MINGLALRLTLPDVGAMVRSLLGVLLVAGIGLHWGSGGAATAAAGAAAIVGAATLQDTPRGRLPMVVAISLLMGVAVLLGTLIAWHGALFIIVVAGWCFVAGMQWAVSANAGLVAAAAGALLVIAPPIEPTVSSVARTTLLVVCGGLLQAVLIALWPQRRWRTQRAALTRAYRSLGADALNLASDPRARLDPEPLISLRAAFTLSEHEARHRPLAYRAWYGLPERIAVTLAALAGKSRDDRAIAEVLRAAAGVLVVIAGRSSSAKRDAVTALQDLDDAVSAVDIGLTQRVSAQLREAVALRFGDLTPGPDHGARLRRPGLVPYLLAATDAVRKHLHWGSPILRHALRLAFATGAGVGIARFADVPHGYWIPLTVLMVLRPETAHTYTRCIGRIAGTAAGIFVASAVTLVWQPSSLTSAVLAVLVLGMAYAAAGFGYVALSATLAAAIVFLLDVTQAAGVATVGDRLIATMMGGALAVLAHVVLPDHSLIRLRQRAGELLKTEIDYAATVIKAFVHRLDQPADALAAAWERAFRARAAFEAAAGATTEESRELRRWMKEYRTALNAVTTSCATLENSLPGQPSQKLSGDFVVAVDEYVEALCGDPATPGAPWRVDGDRVAAAEQRVRDAATHLRSEDTASRVLVSEIGTITQRLAGILDR